MMAAMNLLKYTFAFLLALSVASPAAARGTPAAATTDTSQTQWLTVLLSGRKVGHMRIEREFADDKVTTRQFMSFEMGRAGIGVVMTTLEEHEETPDGQPLAFSSLSTISGLQMRSEGRRIDGERFALKSGAVGAMRESEMTWPEGALLSWGMERQLRGMGTEPGTKVQVTAFNAMMGQAMQVETEVIGPSMVTLPSGTEELIETRETMNMPGGSVSSRSWMDAQWRMQRTIMEVMGDELELLACSQACAEAPNQPAEILTSSLVQVPEAIDDKLLGRPLTLVVESEVELSGWPGIDGQKITALGNGRYRIDTVSATADPMPGPGERDLARTDWLDYDTPSVKALLEEAVSEAGNAERMQILQDRVHRHINRKSLNIGYASAGDAARLREGDCTEHALLLAALGRSLGIPTRVVNGLAYAGEFEGNRSVFVPHAWVTAWTGERWQAFDAALPGPQLRIAMVADDGDPWRFYSGLEAIGRLRVASIRARDE